VRRPILVAVTYEELAVIWQKRKVSERARLAYRELQVWCFRKQLEAELWKV